MSGCWIMTKKGKIKYKKHKWGKWRILDRPFGFKTRGRQCKHCHRWQVQERRPEGWT